MCFDPAQKLLNFAKQKALIRCVCKKAGPQPFRSAYCFPYFFPEDLLNNY